MQPKSVTVLIAQVLFHKLLIKLFLMSFFLQTERKTNLEKLGTPAPCTPFSTQATTLPISPSTKPNSPTLPSAAPKRLTVWVPRTSKPTPKKWRNSTRRSSWSTTSTSKSKRRTSPLRCSSQEWNDSNTILSKISQALANTNSPVPE